MKPHKSLPQGSLFTGLFQGPGKQQLNRSTAESSVLLCKSEACFLLIADTCLIDDMQSKQKD